ncbi:MAG: hypothetical protein R3200_07350 [Xanthomonadales bacterium]|nr:hypothetical protein [Xanthomonadales bacterium]
MIDSNFASHTESQTDLPVWVDWLLNRLDAVAERFDLDEDFIARFAMVAMLATIVLYHGIVVGFSLRTLASFTGV